MSEELERYSVIKGTYTIDSLLGKGAEVTGQEKNLNAIRLFVGDDAKVEL